MVDKNSQVMGRIRRFRAPDRWSIGAAAIACLIILPIAAVLFRAIAPGESVWAHLWATTLPRYLQNSATIVIGTGALAGLMGTVSAWLVAMYRFPGSRIYAWILLLPLAVPGYVGAFALVDFLEYAGPVQTALREVFGWQTSRDYWFPEIRSRWAAIIVLAAALYPYVFLMARAAFLEQSGGTYEVARALGAGAMGRFFRVGLPLARPAIAAGVAIVMMETISDFGVVSIFAVQTLTTGIFTSWLEAGSVTSAAQIAMVILAGVIIFVGLEKTGRAKLRYFQSSRHLRPVEAAPLIGWRSAVAQILCLGPFVIGFLLPTAVLLSHAMDTPEAWGDRQLLRAISNTILVAGSAAAVTIIAAIFMVYGVRLTGRRLPQLVLPVTTIGYAAPGAVLALGLVAVLSRLDHAIADGIEALFGVDIGLVLTGTGFAIIYAYVVRFFAVAQGAVDGAFGRISPSIPMAARSLGQSKGGALLRVQLPLMRGSIIMAFAIVFVDCVKELPATLILRPFNFNTLSTYVFEKASLEKIGEAAPPSLLVMALGLVAVFILIVSERQRRQK